MSRTNYLRPLVLLMGAVLAACLLALTFSVAPRSAAAQDVQEAGEQAEVPDDRFIFVFTTKSIPADFDARVAAAGGSMEKTFPNLGIASTRGLSSEAAASLGAASDVAHWNADVEMVLDEPVGEPVVDPVVETDAVTDQPASPTNPTTARFYASQWNLPAIGADKAWAAGKLGSPSVKVAIIDTGLDYTHPDLVGRVDLSLSRSFVPAENAIIQQRFPGAHPIADLHFHGTHVGATVASNAFLAAGVTSRVTLVGLKVLNRNNSGNALNTLEAIEYASDIGVDVINISLAVQPLERRSFAWFNEMVNRATTYAHSKGATVVVSAGNEKLNLDQLGNSFKEYCTASTVACISATGPTAQKAVNGPWEDIDAKAPYSNFGRSYIHTAAPGGNGASAVTAACSRFSLALPACRTHGSFNPDNRNRTIWTVGLTGTSMAASHASGLAALLVEPPPVGYGRKPGQIREALAKFSDDLGETGNDPVYGKGRINVAKALGLQ